MTERKATFFVCDETLVALNGKLTIGGMYTGDIGIAEAEVRLNQLIIFVQIETPAEKPFQRLSINISFPGEEKPRTIDGLRGLSPPPGHDTIVMKRPVLFQQVALRPGPIEVRVVHEEGEIFAGAQWVIYKAPAQLPRT